MTIVSIISEVQSRGIHLYLSDGRLRVNAPAGILTSELKTLITAHRAEIIEFLSRALIDEDINGTVIARTPAQGEHPLSYQQRQLWFLDALDKENPTYNVPLVLRLRGPLDQVAIEAGLRAVIERHSALRTTFTLCDAEPVQRINPQSSLEFHTVESTPAAALNEIRAMVHRKFDLARDMPVRALLAKLGDDTHLFALTFHHIVCDGWSHQIVMRELSQAYSAISAGRSPSWTTTPIQYVDFAHWQRTPAIEERILRGLKTWQRRLNQLPGVLELPTDHPRPARQNHCGRGVHFTIESNLTSSLRSLATQHGCTMFMVMLAVFDVLLWRYTGQLDLAVGSPTANRIHEDLEETVGFFANTLALRVKLVADSPFVDVLRQVREVTLEAYEHQVTPFERVVAAVTPDRSLSHMPLCQVEFVFQNTPVPQITLGNLEVEIVELESEVAKFDLSLGMMERDSALVARFEYDTELFEPSTIERMTENYKTLCAGVVAEPQTPICFLPLLSSAEKASLLQVWNRPEERAERVSGVNELFAAQARRTPDSIALVVGEDSLTYSRLHSRARELAACLRARGVGPDVPVAFCLHRSSLPFIAMLGVLEAGGAYVPLDSVSPKERLLFMLEDAAPSVIITQEELLPLFDDVDGDLLLLNNRGECSLVRGVAKPAVNKATAPLPNSLAYILFTSGSTGRPKGVALQHDTLVNLVEWYATSYPLGPTDKTLQFASISFDVSFEEAFTCWNTGGTLMVVDDYERLAPRVILDRLAHWSVDRVIIPVVVLQAIAREFEADGSAPTPRLRQIITSGSQLQVTETIRRFCRAMPGCVLHNNYGPAETHAVTRQPLGANPDEWPDLPSIGRPIANTRCYVVDDAGELLPIGVKGELLIGGIAVGRGYYQQPVLTAKSFVPDPWGLLPGGRLFRTRDLVCAGEDGRLNWLGRIDDQVKIRGVRVELGEIETALRSHPLVVEVAARVWNTSERGEQVVAYVEPRPAVMLPAEAELIAFLKNKLPRAMMPSRVLTIAKIPIGPTGKIDRKALPAPTPVEKTGSTAQTEMERIVAGVWTEVLTLSLDEIGVHDNFFSLGGHSLLVGRVIAHLQELTGIEIPLIVVFEHPTVAELAEWLEVRKLLARVRGSKHTGSADATRVDEVAI